MENHKTSSAPDPEVWLKNLGLGKAETVEPYTIYPVCLGEPPDPGPGLLLAHQAIEAELLEILEKGEGEVQELLALNKGKTPVVILEGETLVGCKQNRVVARSVIVGKGKKTAIPVGCMEQGRWSWRSERFGTGAMRMSPSVRRATSEEVRVAKRQRAPRATVDQSRLWEDVGTTLDEAAVASGTSDYHAFIEERSDKARKRSRALKRQPGQVGVLVMAGPEFLGLELTGHPETWDQLADRTLPAFLMDTAWTERKPKARKTRRKEALACLERIQNAQPTLTPGLGLGKEIDFEDGGLAGSGLWHKNGVVHLAVFAN
jgi:hypothetical protein